MKQQIKELGYILRHPSDGFSTMKFNKSGSMSLAFISSTVWFFATLIQQQYTSYRFNELNTVDTNILYILLGTIVIFICFTIANWSVCTLFDGEGSYKEIFIATGYALIPYSISMIIATMLSHALGLTESVFISFITIAGLLYSTYILSIGLMQIHDYTFIRMLISVITSIIGILLIVFLGVLVITLFSQLFSFISSVIGECMMRGLA